MNGHAIQSFVKDAAAIWLSGGWGMVALAFCGLVMFGLGSTILLKLIANGLLASVDTAWIKWKRSPAKAHGVLSRIIAEAMGSRSLEGIRHYFDVVERDEIAPFDRDLKVMAVAVSSAPLLGLLGTVTGMLSTFDALATGGGGDKTMGMVAGGISEALVTTETGLVLALSGMIFQFALSRQQARFATKFTHMETLCMQEFRRREAPEPQAVGA